MEKPTPRKVTQPITSQTKPLPTSGTGVEGSPTPAQTTTSGTVNTSLKK